jgi:hypothetical protein
MLYPFTNALIDSSVTTLRLRLRVFRRLVDHLRVGEFLIPHTPFARSSAFFYDLSRCINRRARRSEIIADQDSERRLTRSIISQNFDAYQRNQIFVPVFDLYLLVIF